MACSLGRHREIRFALSIAGMKRCYQLRQPVKLLSHPNVLNPAHQGPGKQGGRSCLATGLW